MSQLYDRVALIGLGLIASSLFWAMKRDGLAGEVVAMRAQARRGRRRVRLVCAIVFMTPP